MTQSKHHWYDGWFYDKIIAPNQDKLFGEIKNLISVGSNVLDVGCGTGRMEFTLADKCKFVLGIDLSKTNIERADYNLSMTPDARISFRHGDISEISSNKSMQFDFAILTYVIHEVDESERTELLKEIMLVADKLIIGDYIFPAIQGFGGWMSKTIEFIAGKEHYSNYKSYMKNGGTHSLAEKAGLKIIYEQLYPINNNHIIILSS